MADDKVTVQYIDSALAAQNGCQPFQMGYDLAQQYETKGWVKILNRPPRANPPLPKPTDQLVDMPEEENLTRIAWITAKFIDVTVRKVGEKLGFKVEHFSSTAFSSGHLMKAKLMIVESGLRGFTSNQLENLRCIQFQKRVPFVFRIVGYDNSQYFKESLIHSKLNIFTAEKLLSYTSDLYDDLVGDWMIEDRLDYYSFWRGINNVLNPPAQPKEEIE